MALRNASLSRLKQMLVMKMQTPGNTVTIGCVYTAVRSVFSMKPHSAWGGRGTKAEERKPAERSCRY